MAVVFLWHTSTSTAEDSTLGGNPGDGLCIDLALADIDTSGDAALGGMVCSWEGLGAPEALSNPGSSTCTLLL